TSCRLPDAATRPGRVVQLHRPLLLDLAGVQPGAVDRAAAVGSVRGGLHACVADRRGDAAVGAGAPPGALRDYSELTSPAAAYLDCRGSQDRNVRPERTRLSVHVGQD